jgi:tRNA(Ile)-lysidine synthase
VTPATAGFDADLLLSCLQRLPATPRYWVGYSGGADSTALLAALTELGGRLPAPVRALHFHHGLHASADAWQQHCARFCAARGIPFHAEHLDVPLRTGRSPELDARRARYRAVSALLRPGEIYLTAHQANDRAETLFLHLMRGSGIDGLASIPELRALGPGWVARPLLDFFRSELEAYLAERDIRWVDDPGNRDLSVDRNYLRLELFPELERRWPGLHRRLAQTARHARATLDALAAGLEASFGHQILDRYTLAAKELLELPAVTQSLLIRHWVRNSGTRPPPRARLTEFLDQLRASAGTGSQVELRWEGWQIKRHRDRLWLHRHAFPAPCPEVSWPGGEELRLGPGFGTLRIAGASVPSGHLQAGPRRTGAGMRLHPGGPRRPLKDLLRECGVPPWLRHSVPVLYRGNEVLALGDWVLAAEWQAWLAERGASYRWHPEDELLEKLRADCHASSIDRPTAVG